MKEKQYEELRSGLEEEITVQTVLERAVFDVLPDKEGVARLMEERPIKLYLGIDPTSPDLHVGHAVPLRKLKQFQDLGHEVTLLFGTFTGKIGDPTDKLATRKKLNDGQIETNIATYIEQAGKILDFSDRSTNPVKIVYNEEWLGRMNFAEVVELASNFSVQQMLERSMFQERIATKKPLFLHELLYPLMQGMDSVALGVDLEIGGSDQIFNMLVGRDLMRKLSNREKWVMALKLIEDPNGRKMGKTEGNIVNVMDPASWKYEAMMTWPDGAIPVGFELLTNLEMRMVDDLKNGLMGGGVDVLEAKRAMAYRVVAEFDGEEAAVMAETEFDLVHKNGELPSVIKNSLIYPDFDLYRTLVSSGLVRNYEEAKQVVSNRSVLVDNAPVKASFKDWRNGQVLSIGRKVIKNYRRIVIT